MNVSLTPELEAFIQQKLKGGRYFSASEVVRAGLRLLEEQEPPRRWTMESLRAEVQKGLDSLEAGHGIPINENTAEHVKQRGRARLKKQSG